MTALRQAASVILARRAAGGEDDREVYLVRRSPDLRFLGGQWAFPGGAVDPQDGSTALAGAPGEEDGALLAAALRELFEETGVLRVRLGVGARLEALRSGAAALRARLAAERDDAGVLSASLREHEAALEASGLRRVTRLVTPPFSRIRFDTTFFALEVPAVADGETGAAAGSASWGAAGHAAGVSAGGAAWVCAAPSVIDGELVEGAWLRPAAALARWRRGEMRIAPPVHALLEMLAERGWDEGLEEARSLPPEFEGSGRAVAAAPGYAMVPLETPPLPPEIPTNTLLVGERRFIVIDPAPRRHAGKQHLERAIERRLARGDQLLAIVLTHHHPDHVGALDMVAERFGAPLWAHERTRPLIAHPIARTLADGDRIALGESPDGRPDWHLRVLFTPGHAEDHIALHDPLTRSLVLGDLLSTLVSMYVGAPGARLRDYFASLERIRALDVQTFYPAHGTPGDDLAGLVDRTIAHRLERIEEARAQLRAEPREASEIADAVYPSSPARLRPLFTRTTRAALEHLVEEGAARRAGDDAYALA